MGLDGEGREAGLAKPWLLGWDAGNGHSGLCGREVSAAYWPGRGGKVASRGALDMVTQPRAGTHGLEPSDTLLGVKPPPLHPLWSSS